jgi:hypothetical protein
MRLLLEAWWLVNEINIDLFYNIGTRVMVMDERETRALAGVVELEGYSTEMITIARQVVDQLAAFRCMAYGSVWPTVQGDGLIIQQTRVWSGMVAQSIMYR